MFHILAIVASIILLSSMGATFFDGQYSGASKESQVPDLQLDESTVSGDNQNEQEVQEEEPAVKDGGEPETKGEDEVNIPGENQTTSEENETQTEDNQQVNAPRRKVEGGLDIVPNQTQFTVPPPYHMKITFRYIAGYEDHEGALSGCGEYDLTVYVQGKKVSLTDAAGGKSGGLWDICDPPPYPTVDFKPGTAEVTLDIPAEAPQDPRDSQPLSIFTVGTEIDGCMRGTLPSNLKEVQGILSDKGTTPPYYAGVKEKIAKIQSDINSQLPLAGCLGNPSLINDNDLLGTINEVYNPPAYGKHRGWWQTNETGPEIGFNEAYSSTGDFYLQWLIDCPLCATLREH